MSSGEARASNEAQQEAEFSKCAISPVYFTYKYVRIYSAEFRKWIPFHLWPEQVKLMRLVQAERKVIVPKSRQLGFTWVMRAYYLWAAIFQPVANIVFFSKSDPDAKKLLSESKGFKGMYYRLPEWIRPGGSVGKDNEHEFVLPNGSNVECRPYTQAEGDTYSHCLIDEADRFPHDGFSELVVTLEPALEKAQSIVWGSIVDKDRPESLFKNAILSARRAADEGRKADFELFFMPWSARPDRDEAWYEGVWASAMARMDDAQAVADWMGQQYPGTLEEALAPSPVSKRIPWGHIERIWEREYKWEEGDNPDGLPPVGPLRIYEAPREGHVYVIGADPSEGVGGSESVFQVLDAFTGRHVAMCAGMLEPKVDFPRAMWWVARYYNNAALLIENNNHGLTVIAALETIMADPRAVEDIWSPKRGDVAEPQDANRKVAGDADPFARGGLIEILWDPYVDKMGWGTTLRSKTVLYDMVARKVKDQEVSIRDRKTAEQLGDIDKAKLRASKGKRDDRADAYALGVMAIEMGPESIDGDPMA